MNIANSMVSRLLTVSLMIGFAASAQGQDVIHTFVGEGSGGLPGFGYSVSGAGDVNNDGVFDIIVGAPYEASFVGQVKVYSGADGSLALPALKNLSSSYYGFSVAGIGDVDADGHDDVLIGDPQLGGVGPGGKGFAEVRSGKDGSVLQHQTGDAADEQFGWSVAAAGDVNADGFPDWVVGATEDHFSTGPGYVRVFSGRNGKQLLHMSAGATGARFGQSVVGAGDVNQDGFADILIGASNAGNGLAQMRSGKTGGVLWAASGSQSFARFGWDLDAAGDVDADGNPDVIIGAPEGYFDVRRASNGQLIEKVTGPPGDYFGWAVAGAGDVDSDGYADLLVGAKYHDGPNDVLTGAAFVYSSRTMTPVRTFYGDKNGDRVGYSVAGLGDVNQDGLPDIAIGANQDFNSGPGFVWVHSGRPTFVGDTPTLSLSTGGAQAFSLDGGQAIAGDSFVILGSLSGTTPGIPLGQWTLPLNPDFWLSWTFTNAGSPPMIGSLGTLDASGQASAAFALPPGITPQAIGVTLDHAFIAFDSMTNKVTGVSNPVSLELVP